MTESRFSASLPERMAAMEALFREHIQDCTGYRVSTDQKLGVISTDVKELVAQGNRQKGKSEGIGLLVGNIPNAFWSVVIAGAGSALTVFLLRVVH